MKTFSKFFLAVIAMSVMAACSSDNDLFSDENGFFPGDENRYATGTGT